MKKLAAIYSVWDGLELMPYSVNSIKDHVDLIIIVYQQRSNFGEFKETRLELYDVIKDLESDKVHIYGYLPETSLGGGTNETRKRNAGLKVAKKMDCTHFFFIDADEVWQDFRAAKQQYIDFGAEGSVAQMFTYFEKPTLRLKDVDNYVVPFIHRLRPDTVCGMQDYPFYADPTRRVNCSNVVVIQENMHHFSWVRRDIEMKARNSSARDNIAASKLLTDYHNPEVGPGYYVTDYQQELVEVENLFNIPYPI